MRLAGAVLAHVRYTLVVDDMLSAGRRASTISMALNGGLAVVKLVAGVTGHSFALVADAVESLGDIFSSAIVWGGLVIASKPADADHPYGHGKAEPLAALAVALMLIGAAAGISLHSIQGIRGAHEAPAGYTLVVLLLVIVVKECMYRYESRTGARIGSTAVTIDAWHHRSDAITSAAAAVGITIALAGGEGYEVADDWAALAACLVIVANGVRFARTAVGELMDTTPDTTLMDTIQAVARETDGAEHVEKILVRKMGPQLYVDLHLEVDPALSVLQAHGIGHTVKSVIMERRPEVADVLVHVEPHVNQG